MRLRYVASNPGNAADESEERLDPENQDNAEHAEQRDGDPFDSTTQQWRSPRASRGSAPA